MKLRAWFWRSVCVLLCAYHLGTSWAPIAVTDEVAFADFALHHDITLFKDVLPESQKIVRFAYGFGLVPVHMWLLRSVLHLSGIGVRALRMPSVVGGLVALGLLFWLMKKVQSPVWFPWGLVFLGTGTVFFLSTHSARPEALILLILTMNTAWVYLRGGQRMGLALGFLAGAGFLLYPAITLIWVLIPVLGLIDEGLRVVFRPRYRGWAAGLLIGSLCIPWGIDIDQVGQFDRFQQLIYNGTWLSPPGIIKYHGNIFAALGDGIRLLVRSGEPGSRYHLALIAVLLAMLMWQLIRFPKLPRLEKLIAGTATTLWVTYSMIHSSATQNYAIYIYPWWIWNAMLVISQLIAQRKQRVCAVLLAGICAVVAINVLTDNLQIPARLMAAARADAAIRENLPAWRQEDKLIGPMILWLYAPDLRIQSVDFIFLGRPYLNHWNPIPWIQTYHPSLILWPAGAVPNLMQFAAEHRQGPHLRLDRRYRLPSEFGSDYQGLRWTSSGLKPSK